MNEQWSAYDAFPSESETFEPQFDRAKFLAFSGWTLLSLCLWAGLIETVRAILF